MGALNGLIELFEVTNYAYDLPVPLHHRKGLTGPLAGLHPTLLQDASIKAIHELFGVSFPEVKGCVIWVTAVGWGNF